MLKRLALIASLATVSGFALAAPAVQGVQNRDVVSDAAVAAQLAADAYTKSHGPNNILGEWVFIQVSCDENPASAYRVIGKNFIIFPESTCIFESNIETSVNKSGFFSGKAKCYYSPAKAKEISRYQRNDGDYEIEWDITLLKSGNIMVGDAEYRRCPRPIVMPK